MTMFERLQKPFLTVETGEAYGPVRLHFDIYQQPELAALLNSLTCCEKTTAPNTWNWHWCGECETLRFESMDSYKKPTARPVRLGTLAIRDDKLFITLPSFKRACLAVPFFHKQIGANIAQLNKADFINKVFGLDERLPHGFAELFKDDELEHIVRSRIEHYETMQAQVEHAATVEEALAVLAKYSQSEANKRLPYTERYDFRQHQSDDPEVVFLGFYIFLRSRELIAIRRWYGETGTNVAAEIAEEAIHDVFGNVDMDS